MYRSRQVVPFSQHNGILGTHVAHRGLYLIECRPTWNQHRWHFCVRWYFACNV